MRQRREIVEHSFGTMKARMGATHFLTKNASKSSCEMRLSDQAEASFQQSLGPAREQQVKLWELRAATSLARLWCDQGKREQART
jgi:hypothetical protein